MNNEQWTETTKQLQMVGRIGRLRQISVDSCSKGCLQESRAVVLAAKACHRNHKGLGLARRMSVVVLGRPGVLVQVRRRRWVVDTLVVVVIAEGLLRLIMCGPWVSDRAVGGLWSRTWIGGLGWRRCCRPPVWGCGGRLLLWKRRWRTLRLSKSSWC